MKLISNSFLFFLSVIFLLVFKAGFAQQSVDSLDYYINKVKQVQSSGDLENAYAFFQIRLAKSEENKAWDFSAYYLYFISKIEQTEGFYSESEVSAVRALKTIDKLENSDYKMTQKRVIYNHLGILYKAQKNTAKALEMYHKSLDIAEAAKDSMVIYNNISNIYKDNEEFGKAEIHLIKAYDFFDTVNDSFQKARVLDNLGFVKSKLQKEGGLALMKQALEIRMQIKADSDLYMSYNHFTNFYKEKNNLDLANQYALKAHEIANSINSTSYRENALRLRVDLKDYSVFDKYIKLRDSIALAKQVNLNKFALMKYNVSEKELETQTQITKKQQYKFILVLISVLGIFLVLLIKSQHKKEKLLQVYYTETRISKKVHDEVANDVYQLMTKLQINSNVKEEVLDDLEAIYIKTRDISRENSAIDTNQDFEEFLTDLLLSYKSKHVNVITKGLSKIDWDSFSKIKKTCVYRVLQELMVNMKKHSQATSVAVTFEILKNKLIIIYSDNGVGTKLKRGNGLQNAENRITDLNGTITFESEIDKNFKATIKV